MSNAEKKVETPETEGTEPTVNIDRDRYKTTRTATGAKSLNNGDEIAATLEGLNVEELFKITDVMFPENEFREKYAKLNVGMQRMNLGNRIRGEVRKIDAAEKANEGDGMKKLNKAAAPFAKERDARNKEAIEAKEEKAKVAEAKKEEKAKVAEAKKEKAKSKPTTKK